MATVKTGAASAGDDVGEKPHPLILGMETVQPPVWESLKHFKEEPHYVIQLYFSWLYPPQDFVSYHRDTSISMFIAFFTIAKK